MRRLVIAVGVVVLLAVAAVFTLPLFVDVNQYRPRIQAQLMARTGRQVSLGRMELKVFPLGFRVENAVLGENRNFPSTQPFVYIEELYVNARLLPLLRGNFEIASLELRKPRIELIRDRGGVWNFSTMGQPAAPVTTVAPTPSAPSHAAGAAVPASSLSLKKLVVTNGSVAVTDLRAKQPRAVYDRIDLRVDGYAPGKPFDLELAAHLPGAGKQIIAIAGTAGPVREDNLAATSFDGKFKLEEVSLSGLKKFLQWQALEEMQFIATGEARVTNWNGGVNSDGNLTLQNVHIRGIEIGYPISGDFKLSADLNRQSFKLEKGELKLGATPVSITGTVDAAPIPAQVDLNLSASQASIADAARLAAAFGVAFNPGMRINGKLDAHLRVRGAAENPELAGGLSARELVITGNAIPQAVRVTSVELALSPAAVRSNEFVATTGNTAVNVAFTLSKYTTSTPALDASVRTSNAQLGELLDIAKAYGVDATEGISGSGPVSLDLKLSGSTKDSAAMNYSGNGSLRDATLNLPALTQPVLVKKANLRFSQNAVMFEDLSFAVGSTHAAGQLSLRGLSPKSTPVVQFALAADRFLTDEWKRIIKEDQPPARAPQAGWEVIPTANAQNKSGAGKVEPLLSRLTGGGALQIGEIVFDQLQMTNARATVKLDRGVILLSPITASLYGGAHSGSISVNTRSTPATYSVSSQLERVDANQLLSAMSPAKKILYGLLDMKANTSFKAAVSSDAARTLDGKVAINLKDGKLTGLDLLHELASIGRFLQAGKNFEPHTSIARMTGNFDIRNGVARTTDLTALLGGNTVAAAGTVDLASEKLDLQMTAVLSKDYSERVGGTQIGGYATTALANSKGELVIPVLVGGTLSQPKVAPDLQRLAKMKLERLLPSASKPGTLTTGILGTLLGGKERGDANQPPDGQPKSGTASESDTSQAGAKPQSNPPPSNPLLDIFQALTGKKKEQKPKPAPPPPPPEEQK